MIHPPSILKRFFAGAILVAAAAAIGSCGYSTKPLYPEYHTIAVSIFGNKTFRREWEFRLTEALVKAIEARTPYKVAPRDKADTVLSGDIVFISEEVLTRRFGTVLPRESELAVGVNFTWKERTGKILLTRNDFNRSATEIPQIGERVEDAEQHAIELLADAIVDQLQTDW